MKKPEITMEQWRQEMARYAGQVERRPTGDGWLTVDELCQLLNVKKKNFYNKINPLREAKRVEVFQGVVRSGDAVVRRAWYRLRPAKGSK